MDKADPYIAQDDLRAAVNAGVINEVQATGLATLAQERNGLRAARARHDEPFEFFSGFAEIFVTTGLVILIAGAMALTTPIGGIGAFIAIPLVCAILAWVLARYFTLKRRMILPSILLSLVYGTGVIITVAALIGDDVAGGRTALIIAATSGMLAMALWYRVFRLPFAMFVLGLSGLLLIHAIFSAREPQSMLYANDRYGMFFDLTVSSGFALSTLIFGILAFCGGMWFDTRDRNRLGRYSATGFWLHLLAAPAMVNTTIYTLYNIGGTNGMLLSALALLVVTVLALIIDRRSFLTAGIIYIALVLVWLIDNGDNAHGGASLTATLLALGALITALGTFWTELRARLMRSLPDFPGKTRLPPYAA